MSTGIASPTALTWPNSTAELAEAERFLAWSFRRWLPGLHRSRCQDWSLVWDEFARQFGPQDGKSALAALECLVRELHVHARRTIRYHRPCCPCLGADEACVIALVSACQNKRWRLAQARAEWMVRAAGVGDLLDAGNRIARVMERHGLYLPQRNEDGADRDAASRGGVSPRILH